MGKGGKIGGETKNPLTTGKTGNHRFTAVFEAVFFRIAAGTDCREAVKKNCPGEMSGLY